MSLPYEMALGLVILIVILILFLATWSSMRIKKNWARAVVREEMTKTCHCPFCGRVMYRKERFCPECGRKLE